MSENLEQEATEKCSNKDQETAESVPDRTESTPKGELFDEQSDRLLFDYKGLVTPISAAALDIAGQLMCDRAVLEKFVIPDQDDLTDTRLPCTEKEIDELRSHETPQIRVLDNTVYGYTQPLEDRPVIFLNSLLVTPDEVMCVNWKKVILTTLTILHELLHWKVRRTDQSTSSIKSFKWSYSAESGIISIVVLIP
eukprot:TRINITY_DN226_c0_g2_i2.p1 TRINITY_DN226_c0_g2~~TRINITY_DN226_c0_g2_i2.p1  ORF type:complete len:195 (-),score=22.43 TRINITY_DN226_c0_g2_i2:459-1043(-)